jgi:thymidine phosphorylase
VGNVNVVNACATQAHLSLESGDLLQEPLPPYWSDALRCVQTKTPIGRPTIHKLVADIAANDAFDRAATGLLMTVCINGMLDSDVDSLTEEMALSGEQFDYRKENAFQAARLVRRYPTGALSEKTALILPALIASARDCANVLSPFLVAKSLSYTGGTWDKLSAVPGFSFPLPGEQSIATLKRCGVAMTVTTGNANPADRKLYQLRSATGTVESHPLIISSIASKHLCFPVHRLLMDIRVGEGAFLHSTPEGEEVGERIRGTLESSGISCSYTVTGTLQPTGSAIGNAVEVAEAICVMGGPEASWDVRGMLEQRLIVVDFFAKLMGAEFPAMPSSEWARIATAKFESGAVLDHFAKILVGHHVSNEVVQTLIDDPFRALEIDRSPAKVCSQKGGMLKRIDQVRLGELVNRDMGGGGNKFEGTFARQAGVVLKCRIGDIVHQGAELCAVYGGGERSAWLGEEVRNCFNIG